MNSLQIAQLSQDSIEKAKEFIRNHQYSSAFPYLVVFLELNPHERADLETEFVKLLSKLVGDVNDNCKQVEIAYEHGLGFFPQNVTLLNEWAQYNLSHNNARLAYTHSKKCLEIAPRNILARKLLDSTKNKLVERWHFRMLNDKTRNDAYRNAIEHFLTNEEVNPDTPNTSDTRILDIGTGTGLLAIYAANVIKKSQKSYKNHEISDIFAQNAQNSKRIIACDMSATMCDIARQTFISNDVTKYIELEHKISKKLEINEFGAKKFDLIVTEVFDAAVFGEGALSTLIDAHKRLLNDNGRVIPEKCEIFITGVNFGLHDERVIQKNGVFVRRIRKNEPITFPALF